METWTRARDPTATSSPQLVMAEILIVCGAGIVSGKEIMALELGQGLAQRGQAVSFIVSFWTNGDFQERLQQCGLQVCILPIGFISATLTRRCLAMTLEQIRRWPGLLWGYFQLLRRLRPQRVVHTNWQHLLLLLPLLRPERDVYWLHEIVPDLPQYRRVFGWLERRVGSFICVSQATALALRAIGISEAKIRVILNGLTDPAGSADSNAASSERFRIGIVGQVNRWKGHDDLLQAFASVARKHCAAELHVFGGGNSTYKAELEQRAAELGVTEGLRWHGYVSDRRLIYTTLNVCVVPSRSHDPFPTTAIEAGFFGLPTIVTRRGGLPEIIEHEVNGLLVEAERPAEIADALCRLIEQPSFRRMLGINARQRAIDHFGRERFLGEFLELLNA
jgi:glycosyltransferase involved in cell wall biosynthesis